MATHLLEVTDGATVSRQVREVGGRVVHRFTNELLLADLPDDVPTVLLADLQRKSTRADHDLRARLVRRALERNAGAPSRAPSPDEGWGWDTPKRRGPVYLSPGEGAAPTSVGFAPAARNATRRRLVGDISVGVVLVGRDQGPEAFTEDERVKAFAEVQLGLDFLAREEPRAQLQFVYDLQVLDVSVEPGRAPHERDPWEALEASWRDAALFQLGYAPGRAGYEAYLQDLTRLHGTSQAFVAFLTRYPLNHFAYAEGEKVVLHYENDGWGVDNLHRVFAHEACHVFGAADEYGLCHCGGAHGHFGAPNNNCKRCAEGGGVDCLMRANTPALCRWTREQIGWKDPFPSAVPMAADATQPA